MGNQGIGSVTTGTFQLESVGALPVTLTTFYLTGNQFSIMPSESWPITLAPGEITTVEATFAPDTTGTFSEVFTVDCEEPAVDPTATINGEATGSAPVADCYVDPASVEPNTGQEATWYGIDSYDPTGLPSLISTGRSFQTCRFTSQHAYGNSAIVLVSHQI